MFQELKINAVPPQLFLRTTRCWEAHTDTQTQTRSHARNHTHTHMHGHRHAYLRSHTHTDRHTYTPSTPTPPTHTHARAHSHTHSYTRGHANLRAVMTVNDHFRSVVCDVLGSNNNKRDKIFMKLINVFLVCFSKKISQFKVWMSSILKTSVSIFIFYTNYALYKYFLFRLTSLVCVRGAIHFRIRDDQRCYIYVCRLK